jgi:RHS repeat-associated protein
VEERRLVTAYIAATYRYGPYGEDLSDSTSGNPFRYTGRRLDPETGLYYYRARYYSTANGRFLQTDPIGLASDLNEYAYTHGDPLNGTDPTGDIDSLPQPLGKV